MSSLTNFLPLSRRRLLMREYLVRFGVVAMIFVNMLIGIAGILLIPIYLFLINAAQVKESRLESMQSRLLSSDEGVLGSKLDTLSRQSNILIALADTPSVSNTIRSVISIPRPQITLSGFSYAPGINKKSNAVILTGTAATRNALRNYQIALQNAPFVTGAGLPVSAYAKDINIPFTITVTTAP